MSRKQDLATFVEVLCETLEDKVITIGPFRAPLSQEAILVNCNLFAGELSRRHQDNGIKAPVSLVDAFREILKKSIIDDISCVANDPDTAEKKLAEFALAPLRTIVDLPEAEIFVEFRKLEQEEMNPSDLRDPVMYRDLFMCMHGIRVLADFIELGNRKVTS